MDTNVTAMEYELLKKLISHEISHCRELTECEFAMMERLDERKLCSIWIDGTYAVHELAYLAVAEYEHQQASLAKQRAEQEATETRKQQLDNKRYRKDVRRSWWQLFITLLFGVFNLFLGAYLADTTTKFDWFLKLFH